VGDVASHDDNVGVYAVDGVARTIEPMMPHLSAM
jgi:hypothetical protein